MLFPSMFVVSFTMALAVFWAHPSFTLHHLNYCLTNCECGDRRWECNDMIPQEVPENVKEIALSKIQRHTLKPKIFCNVSWPDVTKLKISSNDDLYLVNNVFMCLGRIEILVIRNEDEVHQYNESFNGLTNVSVLDLSWCSRIKVKSLFTSLSSKSILPRLSDLSLVEVGKSYGNFVLGQEEIIILGARGIVEINLAFTQLYVSVTDMSPVCDTLVSVNISNVVIVDNSKIKSSFKCHSLRQIDISEAKFPRSRILPKNFTFKDVPVDIHRLPTFMLGLTTIYANRMLPPDHTVYFINSTLTVSSRNRFTEVHISGYTVPVFDLEVKLSPNHLQYIDLSSNAIACIGVNTFKNLELLRTINLANNKLSENKSFNNTFSLLFKKNPLLVEIDLSLNGLNYLPFDVFSSNEKIKYLHLSNNAFKKITFGLAHLNSLVRLDLRNNVIVTLDKTSRDTLDALYKNHDKQANDNNISEHLEVDLRGNPFSCDCASLAFIQWFVKSPIFSRTLDMYTCNVKDTTIPMGWEAISEAEEDCERPRRQLKIILLSSLLPALGIAGISMAIVITIKMRQKKLAKRRFEDRIRLIQDSKSGFTFSVFLSYSSEEHPFVYQNVLQPLQVLFIIYYNHATTNLAI